jgi:hypothetical protein
MPKCRANNEGSIRQKRPHLWEARFCAGRDPGTGKLIRKSVYGSTQQEVRRKLSKATACIDAGTYMEPSKMTFGQWLDVWLKEYCIAVKPRTLISYESAVNYRIKPALGHVRCLHAGRVWTRYGRYEKGQLGPNAGIH